jgi:hypothetical protein
MIKTVLFLLPLLLFSWEPYKTIDDIAIYKQNNHDSKFVQFKAEVLLPYTLKAISKTTLSPKTYTYWLSDCIKAYQEDDNIYIQMQPPWPLNKRQMWTHLEHNVSQNSETITLKDIDKREPHHDGIWFNTVFAQFILEKIDESSTKVTLELVGDPGGFPPQWAVNLMAWEIPYKSLVQLNHYLKEKNLK